MKTLRRLLCLGACFVGSGSAQAIVTNWNVQSASSTLALSGSYSSGGSFLSSIPPRAHNSNITYYTGSITTQQTEASPGILADIEFLSASIDATYNGNWDPLPGGSTGLAPGNYAVYIVDGFIGGAHATIRDLAMNLSSDVLPLSGSTASQTFNDAITGELLSGSMDYRGYGIVASAWGQGTVSGFSGQSDTFAAAGSLTYGPTITTLTIPIQFDFVGNFFGADTTQVNDDFTAYFRVTGNIVATAPTESVPEANSLALLGLAGSVIGFLGYRRQRRSQVAS